MYHGNECFTVGGKAIEITTADFWRCTCSDMSKQSNRERLAEYIVTSSLEAMGSGTSIANNASAHYDVVTSAGNTALISYASYLDSIDGDRPDCISFKLSVPYGKRANTYVFCLYKGLSPQDSPLNLDLWEFYVLPTKTINLHMPHRKTVTLPLLMDLCPIWADYYGIGEAINTAMSA